MFLRAGSAAPLFFVFLLGRSCSYACLWFFCWLSLPVHYFGDILGVRSPVYRFALHFRTSLVVHIRSLAGFFICIYTLSRFTFHEATGGRHTCIVTSLGGRQVRAGHFLLAHYLHISQLAVSSHILRLVVSLNCPKVYSNQCVFIVLISTHSFHGILQFGFFRVQAVKAS